MEKYHGIIINISQEDKSIFNKLKIIGQKTSSKGWILYKIEAKVKELPKTIKQLQDNLKPRYYFHFYRNDELIVVFKAKIFKIKTDKSTWKEAIEYGKSLRIPKKELDFSLVKKKMRLIKNYEKRKRNF
jgi:hypothetical protein